MVQRRHLKHQLLAHLVGPDLQNYRDRFHHEDAADKRQQQLLLDDYSNCANRAAKSERAHVTHKNLCGVRVVPEEADAGTDHRSTENR